MNRMIVNDNEVRVYIMYCSNSIETARLDAAEIGLHGDDVRMMAMPCSGKVDMLYILKAFETGADGLVLLTCPSTKCRHLEGNMRANVRAESVNELLAETGAESARVAVIEMDSGNPERVTSVINEFISTIRSMNKICAVSA